jgi:hypothetical protein
VPIEILSLRRIGARRAAIGVLGEVIVPASHSRVIIDAVMPVVGPIIRVQRIVPAMVTVISIRVIIIPLGIM